MSIKIQVADVEQVYPVRSEVLRPGQPLGSCHYPEDLIDGVFHLVIKKNEKAVAIASFYPEAHPDLVSDNSWRLRGMATLPEVRGSGLGRLLLEQGLIECKKRGADIVWCNARTSALAFYRKLNFDIKGEEFTIENIGPHLLMYYRY